MLIPEGGKKFEKPTPGIYLGRVIDVVELGEVKAKNPQFASAVRTRVVWVLNAKDKEGKPLRYVEQPAAKMTPPTKYRASRMYEIANGVFNGNIPVPFDDEYLVGRANQLVLTQSGEYINLSAILPVPPGQESQVPPVPQGFVRDKDKPKQGQPQQNAAPQQAPAPQSAAPQQAEEIPF
jgi:hypothetical protein